MQCPFLIRESAVLTLPGGDEITQYFYQECVMTGCQMWSDTLQDCRLALSGMAAAEQQEYVDRAHLPGTGD